MRRALPLLAAGLAVLWLLGTAGPSSPILGAPARPATTEPVASRGEDPGGASSGAPPAAADPAAAPLSHATPPREAELLAPLCSLRAAAEAVPPFFPEFELDALRALLMRRPEAADLLAEALPSLGRPCRLVLLHALYSLTDPPLRDRLLASWQEADTEGRAADEALADRGRLLEALGARGDDRLRADILGRLGAPALSDPEIVSLLLAMAGPETDEALRGLALSRLGESSDPRAISLLQRILADRAGSHADRAAAARALAECADHRATEALAALLRDAESPVLTRLAASGLARSASRPEVAASLQALFSDPAADPAARANAGSSLIEGLRAADPEARPALAAALLSRTEEILRRGDAADCAFITLAKLAAYFPGLYDREIGLVLAAVPEGARTVMAEFALLSPLAKGGR